MVLRRNNLFIIFIPQFIILHVVTNIARTKYVHVWSRILVFYDIAIFTTSLTSRTANIKLIHIQK